MFSNKWSDNPQTLMDELSDRYEICLNLNGELSHFNEPYKEVREIRYNPHNETPLHEIMRNNCTKCLNKIIEQELHKYDHVFPTLKKSKKNSFTALDIAVKFGSIACLKIILPYIKIDEIEDSLDISMLVDSALKHGNTQTLTLMLNHILKCMELKTIENIYHDFHKIFNPKRNQVPILKVILEFIQSCGDRLNAKDREHKIEKLLIKSIEQGFLDCVEYLVENYKLSITKEILTYSKNHEMSFYLNSILNLSKTKRAQII